MITVVSTDPQEAATNVYIDKILSVVFSKEIATSFVTSEFVKLYKVVQQDGQADDYQQQAVSLSLVDGTTVKVTPGIPLSISSNYQLLIRGDHNVGDAIPVGIRATDGDVMEGNFVLSFTSGTEAAPEEESTVPQYDVGEEDEITPATPTDTGLEVMETSPVEDLDVNVATLETLSYVFNKIPHISSIHAVKVTSRTLDPRIMPKIPLSVDHLTVSGDTLLSYYDGYIYPSGDVISTERPEGYAGTEYMLPYNHEYEIKLDKRYVSDTTMESTLASDYVIQFTSTLKPLYADPYEVREVARGYIPDNVTDYMIWKMIHTNSKYIAKYFKIDYYKDITIEPTLLAKLQQYVICRTAFDLLNSPMLDVGGNKSKSLGDLSISYGGGGKDDKSAVDQLLEELQNCYKSNLSSRYGVGVKSKDDSLYPGRQTRKI